MVWTHQGIVGGCLRRSVSLRGQASSKERCPPRWWCGPGRDLLRGDLRPSPCACAFLGATTRGRRQARRASSPQLPERNCPFPTVISSHARLRDVTEAFNNVLELLLRILKFFLSLQLLQNLLLPLLFTTATATITTIDTIITIFSNITSTNSKIIITTTITTNTTASDH